MRWPEAPTGRATYEVEGEFVPSRRCAARRRKRSALVKEGRIWKNQSSKAAPPLAPVADERWCRLPSWSVYKNGSLKKATFAGQKLPMPNSFEGRGMRMYVSDVSRDEASASTSHRPAAASGEPATATGRHRLAHSLFCIAVQHNAQNRTFSNSGISSCRMGSE